MGDKVGVTKVVIKIGKKEIELSIEDARSLKEALDGMFKESTVITVPTPYPVYPYYPRHWDWPVWQGTICGGTSDGAKWEASCGANNIQYLTVSKT